MNRCIRHLLLYRSIKLLGLLFLGIFFVYQAYQSQIVTAAPPQQSPPETPSLIRGLGLWLENCAPCHGTTGRGDGPTASALEHPPANFADPLLARTRTLAGMFDVALNGRMDRMMPPWGERLTEQEIWDVVAYAYSLSSQPADLEAGATIFAAACASCHGEEGLGGENNLNDLTRPDLLVAASQQALFESLQADDIHAPLAEFSALSDEALWQVLDFVRTLSMELPVLDGQLQGQVRNGTTGEPVADTSVVLHSISSDGDILQTYTATSDSDGIFTFTKLNASHIIAYELQGTYQGITYVSPEPVIFLPDSPEIEHDLVVYETTADSDTVAQKRLHRIMAFAANQINIADVYVFENTGQQTFVGELAADGLPATVKIGLPADALNILFQNERNAMPNEAERFEDGYFLSSQPVIPGGETLISVSYNIPIAGATYRLETPLFYDIPIVNILAVDQGQVIESQQLNFEGVQSFQGNAYQILIGADLAADQPLVMEISGLDALEVLPDTPAGANAVVQNNANQDQMILLWSIMGVGGIALVFSLVYTNRSSPVILQSTDLTEQKTHLLALLTELDDLHELGEIDDAAYQQLRTENRTLLKHVLAQLREEQF